ncbi:hypothetical protein NX059_008354 [Plenodomus lindquistii]|nr:hypothetical protein NX059_008354 [Plenodomus lindquistii]
MAGSELSKATKKKTTSRRRGSLEIGSLLVATETLRLDDIVAKRATTSVLL